MHPHLRLTARVFGTLDAAVLQDAPCSVLVARAGWGSTKPKRIVVGVDGSAGSTLAVQVAESLASRLGVELQPLIALGGRRLDETVFAPDHADALLDPRDAVTALAAAAGESDLLVVGSGDVHLRRARGPVWDRIVYAAHSSVLVVRRAQAPA